ncbi:MAG TPA: MBL fold metallo-hydrolase [Chloroflexota bacterium]|nr:MBL fold metallo-hydrolase [Chloroflexota bacterium]
MAHEFIWTHQFGPARIAVINEASGAWPMNRAIEGVAENLWRAEIPTIDTDYLAIDFNLMHVALPAASILVDTGFGEYDPTNTTDPLVSTRNMRVNGSAEGALAALGVKPEEITHVLITHMHGDHILGATRTVAGKRVPTYPNARYYIMEAEWQEAPAFHQNAAAINAQKAALVEADAVELTAGDREIIPGVSFLFAPGESAGHAIVRIQADDAVIYNLGDLFHYPAEFRHNDWRPRYRDLASLVASRQKYLPRFLAEDAWLIPAHHRFPAIGKVVAEGSGYRWIEQAP